MSEQALPRTLQEAIRYFADPDRCLAFVVGLRWPNGPRCPRCSCEASRFIKTRALWECKGCKKQYSVKVGTIFEDSPISLDKWLCAIWMIVNAKNGVSSYEIHRALGVTQKTAWFMMQRIRLALQNQSLEKLSGDVEADETYIGGLARNMHKNKRANVQHLDGYFRKACVLGMLERNGQVRAKVIQQASARTLKRIIPEHVEAGSQLITDEWAAYKQFQAHYAHKVINHAEAYVQGTVHTNTIENFWALLKRGLKGTYVSVEPFHLFRYLDEQAYRFNTRKANDQERFIAALSTVAGRRVTYQQLIGQTSH